MEPTRQHENKPNDDGFTQFFDEAKHFRAANWQMTPEVQEVLSKLLVSYKRLRAASYRIGYLEGQVKRYRQLSQTALSATTHSLVLHDSRIGATNVVQVEVDKPEDHSQNQSWWHEWSDFLFGEERAHRISRRSRSRVQTGANYYEMIRQSLKN